MKAFLIEAIFKVSEDECPELGLAVQNHFQAINMRLGKTKKHSKHRQSLVTLSRRFLVSRNKTISCYLVIFRHSLVKMLDGAELDGPPPLRRASTVESSASPLMHHTRLTRRASLDDLEQESCQLTPKIDHRIIVITSEEVWIVLLLQKKIKQLQKSCLVV